MEITFSGNWTPPNKIVYKGVDCLYTDKGFGEYWVQPCKSTDSINGFAGMGILVKKEDLEPLINKA